MSDERSNEAAARSRGHTQAWSSAGSPAPVSKPVPNPRRLAARGCCCQPSSLPLCVTATTHLSLWAAWSDHRDTPGRSVLGDLAAVCVALALATAADLVVAGHRLRRERSTPPPSSGTAEAVGHRSTATAGQRWWRPTIVPLAGSRFSTASRTWSARGASGRMRSAHAPRERSPPRSSARRCPRERRVFAQEHRLGGVVGRVVPVRRGMCSSSYACRRALNAPRHAGRPNMWHAERRPAWPGPPVALIRGFAGLPGAGGEGIVCVGAVECRRVSRTGEGMGTLCESARILSVSAAIQARLCAPPWLLPLRQRAIPRPIPCSRSDRRSTSCAKPWTADRSSTWREES